MISISIYCWCVDDATFQSPLLAPAYIPTQGLKGPHFETWTWPEPEITNTNPAQARHLFLKPDSGPNAKFTEGVRYAQLQSNKKRCVWV